MPVEELDDVEIEDSDLGTEAEIPETEAPAANATAGANDIDAKIANAVKSGLSEALSTIFAQGQEQQRQQQAQAPQEEEVTYDPTLIAQRAARDAAMAADLIDDAMDELRDKYPALPSESLREIKKVLRQQDVKTLKVVLEGGQHHGLAKSVIGGLYVEGKLKPGAKSAAPLGVTTPGASGNPRSAADQNRFAQQYEAKFGRKPSKAALKELMAED